MFDKIPERSGMNSTRISEVLNFRKSLPPIVTNAHVHALMKSPTSAEKEIKELTAKGVLRRVVVPGRGVGGSSISDALVVVEEWIDLVQQCSSLAVEQKGQSSLSDMAGESNISLERYIQHLKNKPLASSVSRSSLLPLEATALMNTGFLTSSNAFINSANIFTRPEDGSLGTLTSIASISKAASGSHAATGGQGATHSAGGGGAGGLQNRASSTTTSEESSNAITRSGGDLQLSLPSTGPFLKLLTSARSHMISLLSKSKYSEAPETLLRERWNGGVVTDGRRSKSGGSVFAELLPGRTRKWKQFYGLRFDWVLAECVGAGLVEVFETGSVGRGVRAV